MKFNGIWLSLGASLALTACQGPVPSAGPPLAPGAQARCDREDSLEATCDGIDASRESHGAADSSLRDFDVRFPWPAIQWVDETLNLSPGHTGSESWADHLGLAGYHDNSVKACRRKVMNVLTIGLAQRWYDARGLGSPPDQ